MKRTSVGIIVALLVIFVLSFRYFVFREGGFGHNWDWTFPNERLFFENFHQLSFYTWSDFNLGGVNDLIIVHLLPNAMFGIVGGLIGAKWLVLTLFLFVISFAYFGFKRLLDFLVQESKLNYLPALLYAFSPFLFNDIIGGSWVMWFSYAWIPTYFRLLVNYLRKGRVRDLVVFLLVSMFVVVSLQNFVLVNILVFLFLLIKWMLGEQLPVGMLKKVITICLFLVLINLYWILPFSYTFAHFSQSNIVKDGGVTEFNPIRNSHQDFWNIISQIGYFDRDMYLFALPQFLRWLLQVVTALTWFSIFTYFMKERRRDKIKKGLVWLFTFLILVLAVKGGNGPFGGLTLTLYELLPPMKMFRSPQHLMLVPAFVLPILFAFVLCHFYGDYKLKKRVFVLAVLSVMIWTSGWWYNGDLGRETLLRQNRDHIDFYRLAPELVEYYRNAAKDRLDYRTFFLPPVFSPSFRNTEYQVGAQGVQPEYLYLDKPTFTSERIQFADRVESSFCKDDGLDYLNYLSLFAVRDLVVRSDIDPHFTSGRYCWDSQKVEQKLDSNSNLSKFIAGKYAAAYRVKDEFFLPLVYTPTTIVSTENPAEKIAEIVSQPGYQIRSVVYSGEVDLEGINSGDGVTLEYKKIDLTKYRIRVNGARGRFPLVFSTLFHGGWVVFPGNESWQFPETKPVSGSFQGTFQNDNLAVGSLYETWFKKPIVDLEHVMANGYANSWLVDVNKLCSKELRCQRNASGDYNFELIIEFLPQRLFYWGLIASTLTWGRLLVLWFKKR